MKQLLTNLLPVQPSSSEANKITSFHFLSISSFTKIGKSFIVVVFRDGQCLEIPMEIIAKANTTIIMIIAVIFKDETSKYP